MKTNDKLREYLDKLVLSTYIPFNATCIDVDIILCNNERLYSYEHK